MSIILGKINARWTKTENGEVYIPSCTIVECDCGEILQCQGFTTTCDCGAEYNWNGTRLAPRSQWIEDLD